MHPKLDSLLDALLQPRCLRCMGPARGALVCEACWPELPWNRQACERCAEPLPSPAQTVCRACARRPPPQQHALTAFRYRAPVAGWLQAYKYAHQLEHAATLARALAERISSTGVPRVDCLIPVPLHRSRQRQRGFNQARELAVPISRHLGIPLADGAATRIRRTPKQSLQASRAQRRRNLRGASRIERDLSGLHVALVDDVITTGATVEELARACVLAGAERVEAWAVARTP